MKVSDIIKKPRFTEKSYLHSNDRKYIFDVDIRAGKDEIAKAVETLFNVNVISVNTLMVRAKKKIRGSKRRVFKMSKYKKAVVELEKGQSIKVFDDIYKPAESDNKKSK